MSVICVALLPALVAVVFLQVQSVDIVEFNKL